MRKMSYLKKKKETVKSLTVIKIPYNSFNVYFSM